MGISAYYPPYHNAKPNCASRYKPTKIEVARFCLSLPPPASTSSILAGVQILLLAGIRL
jgi:hypothetical protein